MKFTKKSKSKLPTEETATATQTEGVKVPALPEVKPTETRTGLKLLVPDRPKTGLGE